MDQTLAALALPNATLLLTYARLQGFILGLPAFGDRIVPVRVRVALAMALTPLFLELARPLVLPETPPQLAAMAALQLILGVATGLLVRLLAMALDIAASAIAASASLSQIVGGANEFSPHPIGNLMHLGGLAVLLALGFPALAIDLMIDSLALWPIGALPTAEGFLSQAVRVIADSFQLAMLMAAPFILGGFLYQALSGVINKVMPALPVVFVGAPGSILLALAGLAFLVPVLISVWADAVLAFTLRGPG